MSQRYILVRVGVGSSPPSDEKAFPLLIRKRLDQQAGAWQAPVCEALMDARAELEASLENMNAFPLRVQGKERSDWLETPSGKGAFSGAPAPVRRGPAFVAKAKLGYARSAVAATVSGAMLGLAGYALTIHHGSVATVVAQPSSSLRAAPENVSKGLEPGPAIMLAAVAASSDPKLSATLGEEWSEPLFVKPESLAKPADMPAPRAAPAVQDGGGAETALPKPASPTLNRAMEDALLERASRQLLLGDIAGARSIYMSLAYKGSVKAAFGLAETYEERFLRAHNVIGMKPEPRLAREWFEKAASLGSEEAARRLSILKRAE
jgi:hypothetical protein